VIYKGGIILNHYTDIVELVALKSITPAGGLEQLRAFLSGLSNERDFSRISTAIRLIRSLQNLELQNHEDSWHDFAGNLRQFIIMHQHRLQVHEEISIHLRPIAEETFLTIDSFNEVNVIEKYPKWFTHSEHLKSVYQLEQRRELNRQIGDGILYGATGYSEYSSPEQKSLIRSTFRMEEGETLIACLPTGGGKSLISQLPAHYDTRGGTTHGGISNAGTTIVIVPTVALSIDQTRSSRKYFTQAISEEHLPQAYYGGISEDKRSTIRNGLLNGTLPLLYTSPEAVFNGSLYQIILEAARNNRITRLVIDEAHIVVDWGGAFRTDFQLLSLFRKKLLEATNGQLRTLLLSATLSEYATTTLRQLFSEEGKLTEIRSDALRFEPIYFIDYAKEDAIRQERILEVLPLLPRQVILYVTSRHSANKWEELIRQKGYRSVTTFTGDTLSGDRESILHRWNANELDMIVATSAFGMGVDKPDVRSVVHCCIPESINRYFQEVGRGGRDGFASISLLSYIDNDKDEAASLTRSSVLTTEKIVKRWIGLVKKPVEQLAGDKLWLDMNVRPSYLKDQETGNQNANWNETVILFLYRWGFIDIQDVRKDEVTTRRQLLIQLLDLDVLIDSEKLNRKIGPYRQKEKARQNHEFNQMIDMLDEADYQCFGDVFQEVYPYTQESCGGCPACHMRKREPNYRATRTVRNNSNPSDAISLITGKTGQFLGGYKELHVSQPYNLYDDVDLLIHYISEMVKSRVNTIVIPEILYEKKDELIKKLPKEPVTHYSIITNKELFQFENLYELNGSVALFYPSEEENINKMYKWTRSYLEEFPFNRIIHLAPKDAFVFGERKLLLELVDGNHFNGDLFLKEEFEEELI
jgi:ATP-dependent DNA helicase RecQ